MCLGKPLVREAMKATGAFRSVKPAVSLKVLNAQKTGILDQHPIANDRALIQSSVLQYKSPYFLKGAKQSGKAKAKATLNEQQMKETQTQRKRKLSLSELIASRKKIKPVIHVQPVYMNRSYLWQRVRDHFIGRNAVIPRPMNNQMQVAKKGVEKEIKEVKVKRPNKYVQKIRNSKFRKKLSLPVHRRRKSKIVAKLRNSRLAKLELPHSRGRYKWRAVKSIKESPLRKRLTLLTYRQLRPKMRKSSVVKMIRNSPLANISLPTY